MAKGERFANDDISVAEVVVVVKIGAAEAG